MEAEIEPASAWWRRNIRRTLVPLVISVVAYVLAVWVPTPFVVDVAAVVLLFAMPAIIAVIWAIELPEILGIAPRYVALGVAVLSILSGLCGQAVASSLINYVFADNPGYFPVTYAAIVALVLVAGVPLGGAAILTVVLLYRLTRRIRAATAVSRALENSMAALTLFILTMPASLLVVEGPELTRTLALTVDFYPENRCSRAGWPQDIDRVAFIGDQQVLGYQPKSGRVMVLSCVRVPSQA